MFNDQELQITVLKSNQIFNKQNFISKFIRIQCSNIKKSFNYYSAKNYILASENIKSKLTKTYFQTLFFIGRIFFFPF